MKMGHPEEDKELMIIRMETLKSMIGKLKNKTGQSSVKENQSSPIKEKPRLVKLRSETGSEAAIKSRPSTLMGSSPLSITHNKSAISTSLLRKHVSSSQSVTSLNKNIPSSTSATSSPASNIRTPTDAITITDATTPSLKVNLMSQSASNVTLISQSPAQVNLLSKSATKVNRNLTHDSSATYNNLNREVGSATTHDSKPVLSPFLLACSPLSELKSLSSAKSHSDSEVCLRRTNTKAANTSRPVSRPSSAAPTRISLVTSDTRPSTILPTNSSSTQNYSSNIHKTSQMKNRLVSIKLQKDGIVLTKTKNLTKPRSFTKRPPTHTITGPAKQITKATDYLTGSSSTTLKKQIGISEQHTSSENLPIKGTVLPKPGKILFQRTTNDKAGKILFDRHASNQDILSPRNFVKNRVANTVVSTNDSSTFQTKNFAHEFKLIRKKQSTINTCEKRTTRTKFFSSDYIPPETCEKAQTILSKYKVVRQKDTSTPCLQVQSKTSLHRPTTSTASVPGKILFQRGTCNYPKANAFRNIHLMKSKNYYPGKRIGGHPSRTFASRRMMYIKRVDPNSLKLQASGAQNEQQRRKEIILSRHGTNYKVAGDLKSLRRLSSNQGQKIKSASAPTAVICNGKYNARGNNKYHVRSSKFTPAKTVSATHYLASQVLKKTLVLTAKKKVEKNKYCLFYNRFGKCKRGDKCHFIHDPEKIAVCTRFLRGTCKDEGCLFSHKRDPDKMPVCSYFLRGECSLDNCPYRHVNVSQSASVCEDFLKGYCPRGKECTKKHILECEQFVATGICDKERCHLVHPNISAKRKLSGSRPPKGFPEKRGKVDAGTEPGRVPSDPEAGKKHKLPKFISEKIKSLRESTSSKPSSFADMKQFYQSTETEKETHQKDESECRSIDDLWGSDFIPLNSSGGESEEESEFIQRMFNFK